MLFRPQSDDELGGCQPRNAASGRAIHTVREQRLEIHALVSSDPG
jgi:hypothetical protein